MKNMLLLAVLVIFVISPISALGKSDVWTESSAVEFIEKAKKKVILLRTLDSEASNLEMADWVFGWHDIFNETQLKKLDIEVSVPPISKIEMIELLEKSASALPDHKSEDDGIASESANYLSALFHEGSLVPKNLQLAECWEVVSLIDQAEKIQMKESIEICISKRKLDFGKFK